MRGRSWCFGVGLVAAVSSTGAASAAVKQAVTGEELPQPVPAVEADLVNQSWGWSSISASYKDEDGNPVQEGISYGDYYSPPRFPQFVTGDAITLAGAFKWRGENIDPVADARTDVGTLTPHCALSIEVVLVGGICQPQLAWYNATDASSAPAPNELYALLQDPAIELSCQNELGQPDRQGFCPLGWDNRSPRDLSRQPWKKKTFDIDVRSDPHYAGGAIAFAIRNGGISTSCSDVVHSQQQHGPKSSSGLPYVSALVYDSTMQPGSIYLAFEDGKMPADDWHNAKQTDGDFNDYVVRVAGCFNQSGAGGEAGAGGEGGAGGGGDTTTAGGAGAGGQDSQAAAGAAAGTPSEVGGAATGGAGPHGAGGAMSDAGGVDAEPNGGSATSGDADDDGGCGCRTAPRSGPVPLVIAALLLGLARRRRKK